jgi:hypothetical protein
MTKKDKFLALAIIYNMKKNDPVRYPIENGNGLVLVQVERENEKI